MPRSSRIVGRLHEPIAEDQRHGSLPDLLAIPRLGGLRRVYDQRVIDIQFGDGSTLSVSGALVERAFGIPLSQWITDGVEVGEIEVGPLGICYPEGDALGIFFELQCSLLKSQGLLAD